MVQLLCRSAVTPYPVQSSALHRLLSDVATELRLDRQHFVGDVLGQLMGGPGRVSAELRAAVQQVADTVA